MNGLGDSLKGSFAHTLLLPRTPESELQDWEAVVNAYGEALNEYFGATGKVIVSSALASAPQPVLSGGPPTITHTITISTVVPGQPNLVFATLTFKAVTGKLLLAWPWQTVVPEPYGLTIDLHLPMGDNGYGAPGEALNMQFAGLYESGSGTSLRDCLTSTITAGSEFLRALIRVLGPPTPAFTL